MIGSSSRDVIPRRVFTVDFYVFLFNLELVDHGKNLQAFNLNESDKSLWAVHKLRHQFLIIYLMLLSDTANLLSVWDNLLSVAIVI